MMLRSGFEPDGMPVMGIETAGIARNEKPEPAVMSSRKPETHISYGLFIIYI